MTRFMASERFSVSRILESAHTQATTALLWPVQVATLVGLGADPPPVGGSPFFR